MKFLKLFVFLLCAQSAAALACSVDVNERWVGNEMVAAVANKYGVSLAKANDIKIENFTKEFIDFDPEWNCPTRVVTEAKITLAYQPHILFKCRVVVNARFTLEIDGPGVEKEYLRPDQKCFRTFPRIPDPRRPILVPGER